MKSLRNFINEKNVTQEETENEIKIHIDKLVINNDNNNLSIEDIIKELISMGYDSTLVNNIINKTQNKVKTLNEIVEGNDQINEAALDPEKLQFIPCQATKGDVKYCVAVGNIFNIKKGKYAQVVEESLKKLGLIIKIGFVGAQKVVKQASTKLIYVIINSNVVSIYTADILKPLNGGKLQ